MWALLGVPHASGLEGEGRRPPFVAVASAQGGRMTFTVPNYAAAEEVMDGGGPVAQSVIHSNGSTSYASLPWGGENAVAAPGLVAFATGQAPPVGYPFYVAAAHPTAPEENLKDPTGLYSLLAKATADTTSSEARLAGDGSGASGGSRAVTSVAVEGDTVTASAENRNEAISFGDGALRIAYVGSRSVTKQTGTGTPVTETNLTVSATTANGMALSFGPQGLVLGDQGVPMPVEEGLAQFNSALEPAHLSVRFNQPQKIAGGVSAAVFEVESRQPQPNNEIPASIVKLRFGGALSSVVIEGTPHPEEATNGVQVSGGVEHEASDVTLDSPSTAMPGWPSDGLVPSAPSSDPELFADFGGTTSRPTDHFLAGRAEPTTGSGIVEPGIDDVQVQQLAAAPSASPAPAAWGVPLASDSADFAFGVILAGAIGMLVMAGLWLRPKVVS